MDVVDDRHVVVPPELSMAVAHRLERVEVVADSRPAIAEEMREAVLIREAPRLPRQTMLSDVLRT